MGDSKFSAQHRQFVDNLQAKKLVETTDTMNIINGVKDAAGSTCIVGLEYSPVYDKEGLVGCFWGDYKNLQWAAHWTSAVETDGAAEVVVTDLSNDLEKLFEGNATARYVAKITDSAGRTLYGWIGPVAVAGNVYTFDIFSEPALSNQNWFQQDGTAFDATKKHNIEIYRYTSSVALGSADTFTEEVAYAEDDKLDDAHKFLALTNGQYMIDYKNGRFLGRKANADDTETITYNTKVEVTADSSDTGTSLTPGVATQNTTVAAGAVPISATSLPVSWCEIQAPFANTNYVFIGDSSLDAADPLTGIALIPGAAEPLHDVDLADIYMDVLVNDEDVVVLYTL